MKQLIFEIENSEKQFRVDADYSNWKLHQIVAGFKKQGGISDGSNWYKFSSIKSIKLLDVNEIPILYTDNKLSYLKVGNVIAPNEEILCTFKKNQRTIRIKKDQEMVVSGITKDYETVIVYVEKGNFMEISRALITGHFRKIEFNPTIEASVEF